LLRALLDGDAKTVLAHCATLAQQAVDFAEVLNALLGALHEAAVVQAVGESATETDPTVQHFATAMAPETVQLFYQIVLLGLRDLSLAPDPRSGFEMVMLRLLAFEPVEPPAGASNDEAGAPNSRDGARAKRSPADIPRSGPAAAARAPAAGDDWYATVRSLDLGGVARMIVENAYPLERNGDHWVLCLDEAHDTLLTDAQTRAVERALTAFLGRPQRVTIVSGEPPAETPAVRTARERCEQHERAVAALYDDETVRSLVAEFGAELKLDSVRPVKQRSDREGV